MSKLNATDIQGFVLRGYNMPLARYLFLHLEDAAHARALIHRLLPLITTGQTWDGGKPQSTVNIAFTHGGLAAFDLPDATLLSFPVEFQQGMKKRAARPRRPTPAPINLAARALGHKIFGQKIVTPKKGYSRKLKHKPAAEAEESVPSFVWRSQRGAPEDE